MWIILNILHDDCQNTANYMLLYLIVYIWNLMFRNIYLWFASIPAVHRVSHQWGEARLIISMGSPPRYACYICRVGQWEVLFNTLRPNQNGRHFANNIFLNENVWISIKISLKLVPKGPTNSILELVQIMAWRRPGDKLSSEAMMVNLPTHICVSRPQWV